jgi:hypothetical protein
MKAPGFFSVFAIIIIQCSLIILARIDLKNEEKLHRRDSDILQESIRSKELDAIRAGVAEYYLDSNFDRQFRWKTNRTEAQK